MKRKQINYLIPKVGIIIAVAILGILAITGAYRESTGEICSGFMGAKVSCVEEVAGSPSGLISFTLVLVFGIWSTINYTDEAIRPSKPKSKKKP